ncbi:MAG: histidinol dehydrogenase [Oscillospiraceae bacterium]|nr:histidinol dehydrogenase [Oscillospiraceae bacterium]
MLKIYDKSNVGELHEKLKNRIGSAFGEAQKVAEKIIGDVRENGDEALVRYAKIFDGVDIEPRDFYISEAEANEICGKCDKNLMRIMEKAAQNIEEYHKKQTQNSYVISKDGIIMGQRALPLEKVAMYVPGGSALYPSTVLMNAIPAKIAGVKETTILTPPKKEGVRPEIVAAAKICGIDKILKAGGAQAVAAVAYGTQSIAKTDKIVGPGNFYVAAAKKLVYGEVDIDMIAGPSEILIVADNSANPKYIAADLMSQAEHDIFASSILVTDSESLAYAANAELKKQVGNLSRGEIIEESLTNYGGCVICSDIGEAIEIANAIAPEHLELAVENCFEKLGLVKNAGSVFLGEYSPEPLGDYFAGTNHVLPTNGTARFSSPLGVDSFTKKSSFVYYSKDKLKEAGDDIAAFANAEKLTAHANSIKARDEYGK